MQSHSITTGGFRNSSSPRTRLHMAAAADDDLAVDKLLGKDPQLVHVFSDTCQTPLARAAEANALKAARCLVHHGALPFGSGQGDPTPVSLAAKGGHYEMLDYLLTTAGAPKGDLTRFLSSDALSEISPEVARQLVMRCELQPQVSMLKNVAKHYGEEFMREVVLEMSGRERWDARAAAIDLLDAHLLNRAMGDERFSYKEDEYLSRRRVSEGLPRLFESPALQDLTPATALAIWSTYHPDRHDGGEAIMQALRKRYGREFLQQIIVDVADPLATATCLHDTDLMEWVIRKLSLQGKETNKFNFFVLDNAAFAVLAKYRCFPAWEQAFASYPSEQGWFAKPYVELRRREEAHASATAQLRSRRQGRLRSFWPLRWSRHPGAEASGGKQNTSLDEAALEVEATSIREAWEQFDKQLTGLPLES